MRGLKIKGQACERKKGFCWRLSWVWWWSEGGIVEEVCVFWDFDD